jgi:23S rRNA (guanosine2251-2'-O)-methyltransferase
MYKRKEEIPDLVFGVRAVIEAIHAEKSINKIMIQRGMNKALFKELKEVLANKKYTLQFVPPEKLNKLTTKNHQGVIAFISPVEYYEVDPKFFSDPVLYWHPGLELYQPSKPWVRC